MPIHHPRLTLLAALWITACADPEGSVQTPDPSGDTAIQGTAPGPVSAQPGLRAVAPLGFSSTALGKRLRKYHDDLDSGQTPNLALAELRREAKDAAVEIAAVYHTVDRTRLFDRWKLVHTLGKLRTPHALRDLAAIAAEPVPESATSSSPATGDPHDPKRAPHCPQTSHGDEEMMIRARAVEGIAALARMGDSEAARELLAATELPAISARRAAVQAYLSLPGDPAKHRKTLEQRLSVEDHWMLSLKPGSPENFSGDPGGGKQKPGSGPPPTFVSASDPTGVGP